MTAMICTIHGARRYQFHIVVNKIHFENNGHKNTVKKNDNKEISLCF